MFAAPRPLSEIMFDKFDADRSGFIDAQEFQQLTFALGYALTPVEVEFAVKIIDTDGSGKIEKNEFSAWWKLRDRWEALKLDEEALAIRQAAADCFNEIDSTKTGVIHKQDFDKFYKEVTDRKLTTKSKEAFLEDLDKNGDGKIQFAEYIEWLQRQGTIQVKVSPTDEATLQKARENLRATRGGAPAAGAPAGGVQMPVLPAGGVALRRTKA